MKIKYFYILFFFSFFAQAQEIQLNYDFLPERNYLTFTFELFKPDNLGSTFFFTDFNFDRNDGANLAYFELARKFTIKNNFLEGLNLHVEYNDGFLITNDKNSSPVDPLGFPINRALLGGFGFPIQLGNFTLNTTYLYKNTKGSSGVDGQFTAVWFHNLFNNKVTLRGFFDFWSEDRLSGSGKKAVLLTEPQILYNLNKNFSVGSEIEISNNFVPTEEFKVFPTIMGRYAF